MKASNHSRIHYVYWLAFLVGLGLRLFQLGAAPLSDIEASWALQALGLAHAQPVILGGQPAYIIITSLLFSIIKNTSFLARLFPALAGSLLVWLPFYFQRWSADSAWLRRAGLVMAFGIAIDPGLVSISRQVGSPIPALAFTLLTLAAYYNRRMSWAGIFAALAVLSGPSFLQGLLILVISWGLSHLLDRRMAEEPSGDETNVPPAEAATTPSIPRAIPAFVLTLLFAGTLFLRAPQGLSALADSLTAYLRLWVTPSGIPALRLPASLVVYQPLVVIFALIAIGRAWFSKQDAQSNQSFQQKLSVWLVVALLLPLLYSGRQVGDLAWALIPLWALASIEISRGLLPEADKTTRVVAACLALLLCVMAGAGWLNFLAILRFQTNTLLYWASIGAAFLLGLVAVLLAAAGWSAKAARKGVVESLSIIMGILLLANTVGMSVVRQNDARELWPVSPTTGQVDLLLATLSDLSSWNTGLRDQLKIAVLDGSPSMQWALRNFPNASFVTSLPSTESPPVVITLKDTPALNLSQNYRGEDFVWWLSPGWQGVYPPDFLSWFAFRAAPLTQGQVILWARSDIFPGGVQETAGSTSP